ncbi:MAG: hypothetical protein HY011_18965 [Acidobacteria bacterium]|nr:hypothetical protein [Acidobacteriota bacterium]
MIKLERGDKMNKAIARAKTVHPRVKWLGNRTYLVTSSDGQRRYTVRFVVAHGHKLAECNCKAGEKEQLCYHVAAAEQSAAPVVETKRAAVAFRMPYTLKGEKYCGVDI